VPFSLSAMGWLLPLTSAIAMAEYTAVRSTCGGAASSICRPRLAAIDRPGPPVFLQGMLSNDLQLLKPSKPLRYSVKTQQGKVIADVRVLCSLILFI